MNERIIKETKSSYLDVVPLRNTGCYVIKDSRRPDICYIFKNGASVLRTLDRAGYPNNHVPYDTEEEAWSDAHVLRLMDVPYEYTSVEDRRLISKYKIRVGIVTQYWLPK